MRTALRTLHRYLGLLLALPLFVQGVTGAILALEPMFQAADTIWVSEGGDGAATVTVSLDAIVAAARRSVSDDMHAIRYIPPRPGKPAEVWFAAGAGRGVLSAVRINPATLIPIGPPEPKRGPVDFVRQVHTSFLLVDYGGRSIVGWVGVGLLLLSVLGIPIWWPARGQWATAFTASVGASGYSLHRRLHGALGIWAVILLLVSSATGAALGFPQTIRVALGLPTLARGTSSGADRSPAEATAGMPRLDAALALAGPAAPGASLRMIVLSANIGGPVRLFLAPPGAEGLVHTVTVTVDDKATRILNVQDPNTLSGAEVSLRWAHDLHFGQGLGFVWRCFTILTGLALPVFAVTGACMWTLRSRNRKRVALGRRDALSVGG